MDIRSIIEQLHHLEDKVKRSGVLKIVGRWWLKVRKMTVDR